MIIKQWIKRLSSCVFVVMICLKFMSYKTLHSSINSITIFLCSLGESPPLLILLLYSVYLLVCTTDWLTELTHNNRTSTECNITINYIIPRKLSIGKISTNRHGLG